MLTDTHVHFDAFEQAGDTPAMLQRAAQAQVARMLAIGGREDSNDLALAVARRQGGAVRAVVGYDRDQAERQDDCPPLARWLGQSEVVAVGEIGLDYRYSPATAARQRRLFESMLSAACEARLPVVVHSREADDDTLSLLQAFTNDWSGAAACPGVLHCFTGSLVFARRILNLGLMISFSGILTFRNAEALREVAREIPDDRLLIETDSPFLAPVPWRGRPNEPAFVVAVAEKLAEVRRAGLSHIADVTSRNAERLFGFENKGTT